MQLDVLKYLTSSIPEQLGTGIKKKKKRKKSRPMELKREHRNDSMHSHSTDIQGAGTKQ